MEERKKPFQDHGKLEKDDFFQPNMTKLSSKLFNACTKRQRESQPRPLQQPDGEGAGATRAPSSPFPGGFTQLCLPGWGFSRPGPWPAIPWTHS